MLLAARALFVHGDIEARFIDGHATRPENVLGQIKREAVGVVELEGDIAREHAILAQLRCCIVQQREATAERALEALLFLLEGAFDCRLGANEIGVGLAHLVCQRTHEIEHVRLARAEDVRVTHGAAHDAAKHVAPALVRGRDAVGDQEAGRTQVIRDYAE